MINTFMIDHFKHAKKRHYAFIVDMIKDLIHQKYDNVFEIELKMTCAFRNFHLNCENETFSNQKFIDENNIVKS